VDAGDEERIQEVFNLVWLLRRLEATVPTEHAIVLCQPGLLCKLHGSSGGGGAPRRAVIGVYPYNVPGERRRRKPTTALTADGDETAGPQRT